MAAPGLTIDSVKAALNKLQDEKRPASAPAPAAAPAAAKPVAKPADDDRDPDIVEPDVVNEAEHTFGDSNKEVSDADMEQAQALKSKAQDAVDQGKNKDAIAFLTKALQLNPSGILYATRGNVFLGEKRPNAAILDCNAAVKINANSAKAYKIRGRAHGLLGSWDEAIKDLKQANQLDYDDTTYESLKLYEKKLKAKQENDKAKEEKKAKDAAAAADKKKEKTTSSSSSSSSSASSSASSAASGQTPKAGMPNFSQGLPEEGLPNLPPKLLEKLMSDADVLQYMQNPKIVSAITAAQANPASLKEHLKDPEVATAYKKVMDIMSST